MQKLFLVILVCSLFGCSGGGGGGGDETPGRTTRTALRLFHGVFDEAPVSLVVDGVTIQQSYFLEDSPYVAVSSGSRVIQAISTRGEILGTVVGVLEDETEYTLLLSGEIEDGSERVRLVEDLVERPDEGQAMFRLYSTVRNAPALRLVAPGVSVAALEGQASAYGIGLAGPNIISVNNSSGTTIASKTVEVADRGEISVLVGGSAELGFFAITASSDLD